MGSSADDVATTALVVALIALFVAVLQFTQQVFGTAEGYRRCQNSVIGPWARLTRLSWRWQGFRYETKFTTPFIGFKSDFLLQNYDDEHLKLGRGPYPLRDMHKYQATQRSSHLRHRIMEIFRPRNKGYFPAMIRGILRDSLEHSLDEGAFTADYVTWMPLLRALAEKERLLRFVTEYKFNSPARERTSRVDSLETEPPVVEWAYLHLAERSWDLMPPDVVRPLVQTTLGDLITIVSRVGMIRQVFEPNLGILNAQGEDSSLTAVDVRGLGTTCQFRFDAHSRADTNFNVLAEAPLDVSDMFVGGCMDSDAFLCGAIPSGFVGLPSIPLVGQGNDNKPMNDFLELFSLKEAIQDHPGGKENPNHSNQDEDNSRKHSKQRDKMSLVVCEAIGIIAPFMPIPGSIGSLVTWPIKQGTPATSMLWESRAAFLYHLNKINPDSPTEHLRRILKGMRHLESEYTYAFYNQEKEMSEFEKRWPEGKANMIEYCRREHEWTSERLFLLGSDEVPDSRYNLPKLILDWHLDMAAHSLEGIDEGENKDHPWIGSHKPHGYKTENWMAELGKRYIKKHEEAVREKKGPFSDEAAGELWWLMIYRSICWYLCVKIDYNQKALPSIYHGSKMPVYIG